MLIKLKNNNELNLISISISQLIDELSKEVTELRRYQAEQDQRINLMRSPSISDLPSRFDEVKKEVHKLKRVSHAENNRLMNTCRAPELLLPRVQD